MSGLDKLIIRIPYEYSAQNLRGYKMARIRNYARSCQLELAPARLRREWVMGVRDAALQSQARRGVYLKTKGHGEDEVLSQVILNPTDFESMDIMFDLLDRLNTGWMSNEDCRAVRMDFCADYKVGLKSILSGVSVPYKRKLKGHDEDNSGSTETVYLGARPDQILIYNKNSAVKVSQRRPHSWTRIERQVMDSRSLQGLLGCCVSFINLEEVLLRLSKGEISPFSGIELGKFRLKQITGSRAQQYRQMRLEIMVQELSFPRARKKLYRESQRNFGRLYGSLYEITPYPPHDEPNAVFQRAMQEFYTGTRNFYGAINLPVTKRPARRMRGLPNLKTRRD